MKRTGFKPRKTSMRDAYAAKLRAAGPIPQKPRSPLNRMSRKTKAGIPARKACCEAVRTRAGGRCEAKLDGCQGEMHHTHEITPRSAGGSITDPDNCLAVCFRCHDAIHARPNESRRIGLLR